MSDVHIPALPATRGQRLANEEYLRDFRARDAAIRNGTSWKLERLQHFEEVGSPSRDALRRGDWATALRLFEEGRDTLRGIQADEEARGSSFHRVRVVEEPLTPYAPRTSRRRGRSAPARLATDRHPVERAVRFRRICGLARLRARRPGLRRAHERHERAAPAAQPARHVPPIG
ncbi:DUF6879 family protein [Streptomyces sp. BP-8]|uniref:DUF6879 family protein n=1 Tax=Streptomyces sirii TaxID=3127701 RepID=A0ABZ2QT74_9ACTN